MATEIDHDAIKTKIVAILKASAVLFTDSDLTKIRSIEVGFPDGDPYSDQKFDYIFITDSSPFETIRNRGSTTTVGGKVIVKNLEHEFNYDIVIIVNAKSARNAEEKLDDFQKLTLELLEADASLVGTGSADVDISFPVSVQHYRIANKEGTGVKGRVITLRCIKDTN